MRARIVLLAAVLVACGAAPRVVVVPEGEETTDETPPAVPPAIALRLGQLSLHSVVVPADPPPRVPRPPVSAEMVNDAGALTGTRCGATSLSADGVLRRDDEIVARLEVTSDGAILRDGSGRDTHLVLRGDRIETSTGELRFRRDDRSIVSPDGEVPSIAITPVSADVDTALALFATLLVCNDLGP